MKKKRLCSIVVITIGLILTGCGHEHTWQEASCTEAKVCTECGETEGEALGHTWTDATCTSPKTCSVCAATEGEALEHSWLEATYENPQTCEVCGETQGESLAAEANEYYEMGRAFLYGLEENEISLEFAYNNFTQAEQLGMNDANFYLGLLCDWYSYPENNYKKAKAYYEACEDNPYAQISLGFLYYYGQGIEEDKEKAEGIFQTVVDKGCVEGYLGLADIAYDAGDYSKEFECYNKVLEGTEQVYIASAMYSLGIAYEYGEGVEQDNNKALEWYEKSADLGYADAITNIGYGYHFGEGVEQDYNKALEQYEKAAALNNATAMNNIGYMYNYGEGVEQNYTKALEWYEKAADLGHSAAMSNIGYMYRNGEGAEQDYAKAMEWYEKAAALGDSDAMNIIGMMYGNGEGVEQDYTKALEWHKRAADLGNEDAMENVEYLEGFLQ